MATECFSQQLLSFGTILGWRSETFRFLHFLKELSQSALLCYSYLILTNTSYLFSKRLWHDIIICMVHAQYMFINDDDNSIIITIIIILLLFSHKGDNDKASRCGK